VEVRCARRVGAVLLGVVERDGHAVPRLD
jgi:hypothetical protein